MKQKIFSLTLTFIMAAALLAGCGSSTKERQKNNQADSQVEKVADTGSEDSTEVTKPAEESDTVETEETVEAEETEDQESTEEQLTDEAADEEVDEYLFTASEREEFFNCIREAVKKGYLEPNGIAPEDLVWPSSDLPAEVNPWAYMEYITARYYKTGKLYDVENFTNQLPSEDEQQLFNSVLDGIVEGMANWKDESEVTIAKRQAILGPMNKKIPEIVNFSAE